MPHSFSPFNIFIASMASGSGLPPRIRTPSISNAKAKLSAVGISAGVIGEPGVSGVLADGEIKGSSSKFMVDNSCLALAIEAAKPWW